MAIFRHAGPVAFVGIGLPADPPTEQVEPVPYEEQRHLDVGADVPAARIWNGTEPVPYRKAHHMGKRILVIAYAVSLVLAFFSSSHAGPIPDTGQTKCYDNTAEIPCPQPGEPFYGQDGNFTINPPSYTKLDATGNDLPDVAASWVMVRDKLTGLIWEVKTDDGSIHDKDNTYTWCDSNPETNGGSAGTCGNGTDTEDFINALNTANFGGHSDWRMPTIKELTALVNLGIYTPLIDTSFFPNTKSAGYWSSTAYNATYAWLVGFNDGAVYGPSTYKSSTYFARAVRGGQPESSDRFVVNGDGTVTDKSTGLMWEQKTFDGGDNDKSDTYSWEGALAWVQGLNDASFLGYDDWRLPTHKELQSIVDYRKSIPAIDKNFFSNTVSSDYWSSTTSGAGNAAWRVSFTTGTVNGTLAKSAAYAVRAVRGGQNQISDHLVILTPGQGESWGVTDHMPIAWETQDIAGNVKISLSRDGGKTYETIIDSAENDGSFEWIVTGPFSANCMLKIEPVSDPSMKAMQGFFTISILDLDADGMDDNWERDNGLDPAVNDAFEDLDGDKFTNGREFQDRTDPDNPASHFIFVEIARIADTGQSKCYNNSVEIICPNPGESFYGQDASYTINPPAYVKMDAQGNYLPDEATSWAMVRDKHTGLIWEVKTDDGSIHDRDDKYTWADMGTFINALNTANFGGYSDWRMPTIKELTSLVNLGIYTPLITTSFFPNTISSYYWSSSATSTGSKWFVNFTDGVVAHTNTISVSSTYVRAVRGGQPESSDRFVVNGDGTVTDKSTGLMWEQKTFDGGANDKSNTYTWEGALAWVQGLNGASFLGYDDWRLPNRKELQSIVDYSKSSFPAIDKNFFPNTVSSYYWSSTSSGAGNNAWRVYFIDGTVSVSAKTAVIAVRAVRGGQNQISDHLVILTPGQGESWGVTDHMPIAWETQDIAGNVKISLSRDGGKTYETIIDSAENDGSFEWIVTGPFSANCMLKIEPVSDPSMKAMQGFFTISILDLDADGMDDNWERDNGLDPAVNDAFEDLDGDKFTNGREFQDRTDPDNPASHFIFVEIARIADTGQSKCYNNSVEIICPNPGESFYGQDASYTINPPAYVKMDAQGNYLPDEATSWAMVRDKHTGLIWEVKTDDGSIHDRDDKYTWADMGTFINALNTANFGGYSDWRMPTIKELTSLVNLGIYTPLITTSFFPNTISSYYWSSSATSTGSKWFVNFTDGVVAHTNTISVSSTYVRAVRGGQPESSDRFVVNGDGTVTDKSTGLMWEQKTFDGGANDKSNTYTWEGALAWVQGLNGASFLGYDDWRLPNRKELQSIVDYSKSSFPAIDKNFFPNTVSSYYWSSTSSGAGNNAWHVHFIDGTVSVFAKTAVIAVRAVRGGQNQISDHLVILTPQQTTAWQIGKEQAITWDPKDIQGSVRIKLSRQGGKFGTFETIAESTENDGSFLWTVTATGSVNCVLRIEPIDEPERGTSEGLFGIDEVYQTFIAADPLVELRTYRLSFILKYKLLGYRRVETSWNISDNTVAALNGDFLAALKNGCVVISTTYEGQQYSKTVYFKTGFDQWEEELNDTAGSATQLSECRFMEGELLLEDTDFFKMYLPSAASVEISYFSNSRIADVMLEIFDNANNLLASEVSSDGNSLVFPLGLAAGNYYVKLTSVGDIDQEEFYNLVYKTTASLPAPGVIDIPVGGIAEGTICHLQDKRSFTLNTTDIDKRQGIFIDFLPGAPNADYHITVLNSLNGVVREADSIGGNFVIIDALQGGGSYTIEVTPIQTIDAGSPFTIEIVEADYFVEIEPNETVDAATHFNPGETIIGKLDVLSDFDFYTLRLEAPTYLDLFFDCPESDKDFIISVYKDSDQNLINSITSTAGEPIMLPMGLNIGRYYITVSGSGTDIDTDHLYSLTLRPSSRTNLEIESNNTTKFATPISKEDGRQGRIFSADDLDYFGFNLPEMTVFNIAFTPATLTGDYKISLVDKDDQVFYYKTSTDGAGMNLRANRPPGNYYVKVENNGDVDQYNGYDLVLTADADVNPGNAIDGLNTLVSISITAESDQMEAGETIQLAAIGNYSDASSLPLPEALWSSLDPNVGSVSPSGLVSGISGGEATVVAVYSGLVGQIKVTVGSPADTYAQRYGNLIIVAGTGGDESDPFTQSAQYLSDLIYTRFQNRLFRDEDIYYFNTVSWHDIDGDGLDNDVVDDSSPTITEFNQAINTWAAAQNTDGPLYIYLVGHGLIDTFSFPDESLTALQLKSFVDTFRNATGRRVVVIIEACKSGSFTDDLVSQGEDLVVVTSTDDQDAYLQFGGRLSFTQLFIEKLLGGNSFYQSWLNAKSKLSAMELPFNLMQPQLSEGVPMTSNQTWVGGNFVVASIFPGWLVGQVYDAATGFALENAVVNISGLVPINTISSGYYLSQVPAGTYTVTVTADGYQPFSSADVAIGLGEYVVRNFTLAALQRVETPSFAPAAGIYPGPQQISLSSATPGATIRFTTNGSDPTETSTIYASPIEVSATMTIQAKAFKAGWAPSDIATGTYTITETVAAPSFSPTPDAFITPVNVQLSCSDVGATMRYTTDGSDPIETSAQYTGAIEVSQTTVIKARAFKTNWAPSAIATGEYIIYDNRPFALTAVDPNPAGCNQTITFDGSGSYHGYPIRNIVSYEWDWDNDGSFDAGGATVTHSFGAFGTYPVTLRVRDDNSPSLTDTDSIVVNVNQGNHAPSSSAGGPYIAIAGRSLSLDGSGSFDLDAACGDMIVSYVWDLDNDGQFDDAAGVSPTLPWAGIGGLGLSYPGVANTIGLQVTDSFGLSSVDYSSLTIYLDSDGDGVRDDLDGCPDDPNKIVPGICGCGVADTDSDNDGTPECIDNCPDDPNKSEPGICGCGISDIDSDGDKIADCNDAFPEDPIEKGDVNNDLNVDLSDAILALQLSAGMEPAPPVYKEADVNGDSQIRLEDVIYILQKVTVLRDF